MSEPLKTFICYAHEDREVVEGLNDHLSIFEKRGLLKIWSDGKILAGQHWDKSIKIQLEEAELILLFISVSFIKSEYIEKTELKEALQRHRDNKAILIPIIVRHCHWAEYFDIGQFQALPTHARPILSSHFKHLDEAFFEIAEGVKKTAEELRDKKITANLLAEAEARNKKEAETKAAQLAAAAKLLHSKDEAAWKVALRLDTLEAYEDYAEKYKLHEVEAHERIGNLEAAAAQSRAEQKAKEKAAALSALAAEAQRAKEAEVETQRAKVAAAEAQRAKKAEVEAQKAKQAAAAKALAAKEAALKNAREAKAQKAKAALDPFAKLMINIKGGAFDMGDTFGVGLSSELPVHKVNVRDFYICKYPVTQSQWKAIMGNNPSYFCDDELPVETVSWDDVQKFIKKLNEKTSQNYRLPTEAEWEYAAKGGSISKRFKFSGSNQLNEVAWFENNSDSKTHLVGQKKPNELGLYDMSGNVWEWVEDVWHSNYQESPTDGSAWTESPQGGAYVRRGGSWRSGAMFCLTSYRNRGLPGNRWFNLGFRLALSL